MLTRIEMNVATGDRKVIELTPEEVTDAQARTAAEALVKEAERKAQALAAIQAELAAADLAIIRALAEGDTARVKEHNKAQVERRAKLK